MIDQPGWRRRQVQRVALTSWPSGCDWAACRCSRRWATSIWTRSARTSRTAPDIDTHSGQNTSWRNDFAAAPAPWGARAGAVRRRPRQAHVPGRRLGKPDADPGDEWRPHALCDRRRAGRPGDRTARLRRHLGARLAAGDPLQNPLETAGGQLEWIDRMTCVAGERPGCTRPSSEQAIVVSTTPTYSYGPVSPTDTQTTPLRSSRS